MLPPPPPPSSATALLERAEQLAGLNLQQLAARHQLPLPIDNKKAKGWIGQLLEHCLGATAGSLAEPDFLQLGIELKTLPVNAHGTPQESTYISVVPLLELHQMTWRTSNVYKKLAKVLWVPIQSDPTLPFAERKIGTPLLWSPTAEQEAALQADWEELSELICLGQLQAITARHGRYLQIRPKGANAKSLCWAIGPEGEKIQTLPRGFYLRASFTAQLLKEHYLLKIKGSHRGLPLQ